MGTENISHRVTLTTGSSNGLNNARYCRYELLMMGGDTCRRINFKSASARYVAFRITSVDAFQYQRFEACRLHHILTVLHVRTHTHTHTWLFIFIFPDNPQKKLGYPESAAISVLGQRSDFVSCFVVFQKFPLLLYFFLLFLYVFPLKDARPVRYLYLSCFLLRACSTYFHFFMLSCHKYFLSCFAIQLLRMAVLSARLTFRIPTKQWLEMCLWSMDIAL